MRYTDEYRTNAVLILQSEGYPEKKGALQKTASYLRVPAMTLHRWYKHKQNPPPNEMVISKTADFVELIEDEMRGILGEMKDAIHDADYRELGTVLGILFDKRQLLTGGATENVNVKGLIVNISPDSE